MRFTPITPADYAHLKSFFAGQKYRHSSYSLSGIVVWNNCAFNNYYAKQDGYLVVSESHIANPKARWLLLPVGRQLPPAELAALVKKAGHDIVRYVPEEYIAACGQAEAEKFFSVLREPEYDDYVYERAGLASLKGAKYHKKRNLIAQFERGAAAAEKVEVLALSPELAGECGEFVERWYQYRREKYAFWTDELGCEHNALVQTLNNFALTGVEGLAVKVGGRIEGLGIASRLTDDMAVLNFEKANEEIKGLYQYLDRECAVRLYAAAKYLNKESDLGDEGLRQAKESYYPAFKVASYRLELLTCAEC